MKSTPLAEIKLAFQSNELMCHKVIGMLELVANKARLRTVCMLMHGEYCVQDIVDVAGDGKATNISQQLRMLRLAGVVVARRDGKNMLYRLTDEGPVRTLVEFLRNEYMNTHKP
jgi:DNA-binding transcriptional ArsR family regulator